MSETGSERISLSRETLRAELSQMELRLVDRLTQALSTKADSLIVDQLDKRVDDLQLSRASREHLPAEVLDLNKRVATLERFRYAFPSIAMVSLFASVALTIFYFTHA